MPKPLWTKDFPSNQGIFRGGRRTAPKAPDLLTVRFRRGAFFWRNADFWSRFFCWGICREGKNRLCGSLETCCEPCVQEVSCVSADGFQWQDEKKKADAFERTTGHRSCPAGGRSARSGNHVYRCVLDLCEGRRTYLLFAVLYGCMRICWAQHVVQHAANFGGNNVLHRQALVHSSMGFVVFFVLWVRECAPSETMASMKQCIFWCASLTTPATWLWLFSFLMHKILVCNSAADEVDVAVHCEVCQQVVPFMCDLQISVKMRRHFVLETIIWTFWVDATRQNTANTYLIVLLEAHHCYQRILKTRLDRLACCVSLAVATSMPIYCKQFSKWNFYNASRALRYYASYYKIRDS